MGHTEDNFVEHTEDNFNKQAELFLFCYAGEQLKVVCLPLRVKDDYELLEILSDGEDVKYFNCILRKKADGKKYLLKVKKLSEHSGLEKEMQQMKRLHAASLGQESITVDDLKRVTRIAIVGNHIYASETSDEELVQWVGDTIFLEELAK